MSKLTRNIWIKASVVILVAILITIGVFCGVLALGYGMNGLYDSSYKEFKGNVMELKANKMACETMNGYVHTNDDYQKQWDIAKTVSRIDTLYQLRYVIVIVCIISLIAAAAGFVILMKGAGRRESDDEIHDRSFLDHIPADLYLAIDISIVCILIVIGESIAKLSLVLGIIICSILGILCCIVSIVFFMSIAVQIKQRRLLKYTVVGRTLRGLVMLMGVISAIWKLVAAAAVLWLVLMVIAASCYNGCAGFAVFFIGCIVMAASIYYGIMMHRIEKGTYEILSGNTGYAIDTKLMHGSLQKHAEALNNINRGVEAAVKERMKSERFKTELITNVSHDIKTPLTSIISYTDLLAKEELDNETASEYIEIIARNAQRLKKLTADIVSASKASTGNVKVELADCNMGLMIEQALGEYDEKMREASLEPVVSSPENDITVLADGEHSWRILDNVMNNICKYAQAATRVYIDEYEKSGMAYVEFKNISAEPLNISAEELMERFVRGDESRNTEGSGLGLSIARDLAGLQGGSLDILVDGDLFKVIIGFKIAD